MILCRAPDSSIAVRNVDTEGRAGGGCRSLVLEGSRCRSFQGRTTRETVYRSAPPIKRGNGWQHSFCLPGLEQHQSRLSVFSNPRVEENEILDGHFSATRGRYDESDGPILILQDTTEFTYQRRDPHAVGFTKSVNSGRDQGGRLRHHAVCGILMHSSLAVTTEGLPLGLAAVKFWNREKFKGTAQLKRKINPTRVPIEEKRASAGWRTYVNLSTCLAVPNVASM